MTQLPFREYQDERWAGFLIFAVLSLSVIAGGAVLYNTFTERPDGIIYINPSGEEG